MSVTRLVEPRTIARPAGQMNVTTVEIVMYAVSPVAATVDVNANSWLRDAGAISAVKVRLD